MGKDFWKFMMYSQPEWYLGAKSGAFGDDAQKAADEYEQEVGPGLVILFIIVVVGILGYLGYQWLTSLPLG